MNPHLHISVRTCKPIATMPGIPPERALLPAYSRISPRDFFFLVGAVVAAAAGLAWVAVTLASVKLRDANGTTLLHLPGTKTSLACADLRVVNWAGVDWAPTTGWAELNAPPRRLTDWPLAKDRCLLRNALLLGRKFGALELNAKPTGASAKAWRACCCSLRVIFV